MASEGQTQPVAYVSFSADIDETSARALLNAVAGLVANGTKEIHLLIATGGGSIMHGFALYNTLRALPVKLVSHNVGNIDSIGNVVFLAADERYSSPHS